MSEKNNTTTQRVFWDIDETLIHTSMIEPKQKHCRFSLEEGGGVYFTIFRPCAKDLIAYSRSLFGVDNVYILTAATIDYAREINRLGEFGFSDDHIIAREHISDHRYSTAYGGSAVVEHKLGSKDNVIIDNLPAKFNEEKTSLLGIWKTVETNYFQIKDYYGVNFPNDSFETDVQNFLQIHHDLLAKHKLSNDPSSCSVA